MTLVSRRIVHIGLGAFQRAHLAWYTQEANRLTGGRWSIVSFAGLGSQLAQAMRDQDCVYTLITRGPERDEAQLIGVIEDARDADDVESLSAYVADAATAMVTLTVTEAGYLSDDEHSVAARLVSALRARRASGAGPIAVVSLDNLMHNGVVARDAVFARLKRENDGSLSRWVRDNVSFPSTMVDRITPPTTPADVSSALSLTGFADAVPVVTEPFAEWVIAGTFPAGRPHWECAGARFVASVDPFESRKLWLLNGSHSLLAYLGLLRGHETVAQAMSDPECVDAVEALWADIAPVLEVDEEEVAQACADLRERFANPNIEHRLETIARDGSLKLPVRIIEPLRKARDAGLAVDGMLTAVAAWIAFGEAGGLTISPDAGHPPLFEIEDSYRTGPGHEDWIKDSLSAIAPDLSLVEDITTPLRAKTLALMAS